MSHSIPLSLEKFQTSIDILSNLIFLLFTSVNMLSNSIALLTQFFKLKIYPKINLSNYVCTSIAMLSQTRFDNSIKVIKN